MQPVEFSEWAAPIVPALNQISIMWGFSVNGESGDRKGALTTASNRSLIGWGEGRGWGLPS